MSKASIQKLFDYNEWAWQRVFASLVVLPDADYFVERPFFWHSLHSNIVHCYSAEWMWFRRCQGDAPTAMLSPNAYPSFATVREAWDSLRAEWRTWVAGLSSADLEAQFHYRDTQGNHFSVALDDLLRHVVNHATEHRSQITPVLFQLGHPTEPLDYIFFARTFHPDES